MGVVDDHVHLFRTVHSVLIDREIRFIAGVYVNAGHNAAVLPFGDTVANHMAHFSLAAAKQYILH